ncbi:acyltransferase family protein [Serratia marcescens]|uniref:acyltransferase family protein n=1 Tax=Serratia marcescens TaxID=615 RepID=UPI0013248C0C|nr:acyltransferase [Serratia marcescens]MXS94377.1 acyltransferase family protein [Serratia marcescens]QHJ25380.1 acyltransferase family protein [Serratia marcescens]
MSAAKVNNIHYLRGAASLLVVCYHLKFYLNNIYDVKMLGDILFKFGAFGVDLFFVISGFVICLATEKKENSRPTAFILHRFFRIYPLLVFCMAFFYFLFNKGSEITPFLRGVIPLNANYSAGAPFFGWNILIPAWTLTYELAFYSIFLFAMTISHKNRILISTLLILFFIISFQWLFSSSVTLSAYNNNSFLEDSWLHAPVTFLASPLFIDFIYGMVIYLLFKYIKENHITLRSWLSVFLVFVLCSSFVLAILYINAGHGPLRWGILGALIVISLVILETQRRPSDIKPLALLGDISYSLYLSHEIVIKIITKNVVEHGYGEKLTGVSSFVMMILICIIVAICLNKFIERPFIRLGRRILLK